MKRLWQLCGSVVFWLSWPLWRFLLTRNRRVRILVIADGRVLVVKRWLGTGKWHLPGGGLAKNEAPRQGAIRELAEETGIKLRPEQVKQLSSSHFNDQGLKFSYKCFYVHLETAVEITRRRGELVDAAWLPVDDISSKNSLQDAFEAVAAWREL